MSFCTFSCNMKNELPKHTTYVHQNHMKGHNTSDNPILSQLQDDKKGLSHVKFKKWLEASNLVEVIVPGNGFCFLSKLLFALGESGINKDMNNISIEVMNEIRNNMKMYKEISPIESKENILKTCEAFFQERIYSHEFVDFCIDALAKALAVNIHIFQKGTYRVTVTSIKCHKFVSVIDLFCVFHKSKMSVNNLDCHYNPYVESQYLKTHKEEIKSQFVLATEEEAEHDSSKFNKRWTDAAGIINRTIMDSSMESRKGDSDDVEHDSINKFIDLWRNACHVYGGCSGTSDTDSMAR